MKFTLPTRSEFRQFVINVLVGLRPGAQTGPGSDIHLDADGLTAISMEILRNIRRDVAVKWVKTAVGDAVDDWLYVLGRPSGEDEFGRIQLSITDSVVDALAVTASNDTGDLQDEELTDAAGNVYKINESKSFTGGSYPRTENFALVSVSTGTVCNIPASTPLTFAIVPANVDEDATTVQALTGATDKETDVEGRARCIEFLQQPGMSGNADQIREVIEAVNPGVFDAFIFEMRDGFPYGWLTFDYCAVYANEDRTDSIISAADKALITAAVTAQIPVDQLKNARHLDVTESQLDVSAKFVLDPDASSSKSTDFDSDDLGGTCNIYVAADPVFTCTSSANVHLHITVGDFAIINSARGKVAKVGLADGLANDAAFTLETDLFAFDADINPFPLPTGYDMGAEQPEICSGGGVAEAVYASMFAYFRIIGPTKESSTAAALLNWRGTYYKERAITAIIDADDDIIDSGYISPSDTDVVDPLTTDIPRIMPGELAFHEDKP